MLKLSVNESPRETTLNSWEKLLLTTDTNFLEYVVPRRVLYALTSDFFITIMWKGLETDLKYIYKYFFASFNRK